MKCQCNMMTCCTKGTCSSQNWVLYAIIEALKTTMYTSGMFHVEGKSTQGPLCLHMCLRNVSAEGLDLFYTGGPALPVTSIQRSL